MSKQQNMNNLSNDLYQDKLKLHKKLRNVEVREKKSYNILYLLICVYSNYN